MATNPMKRKARISFLLGMLVMLLILGAVIVFLVLQLLNNAREKKEEEKTLVSVYVLDEDVSSGQVVTKEMFRKDEKILNKYVPSNAFSDMSIIDNYSLQDKEGNEVKTKYDDEKQSALYLEYNKHDSQLKQETNGNYYIEYVKDNENNYFIFTETETSVDSKNQNNKQYEYAYIEVAGNKYKLCDETGKEVYVKYGYDENGDTLQDKFFSVLGDKEVSADKLFFKNGNASVAYKPEKKYIELNSVPLIAKVTMKKNTVLTKELLAKGQNEMADDVRKEEFNMFVLPTDIKSGDYVDVRLVLPNGQNYIVVSKKEVEIPNIGGNDVLDTIWLKLKEDEILSINSAIIDAYKIEGSKIYVNQYTDAGLQKDATPTYVVNQEVATLIAKDPNVLANAREALRQRYIQVDSSARRGDIENNFNKEEEQEEIQQKVQQEVQKSTQKSQETRQKYLDSLSGQVQ